MTVVRRYLPFKLQKFTGHAATSDRHLFRTRLLKYVNGFKKPWQD